MVKTQMHKISFKILTRISVVVQTLTFNPVFDFINLPIMRCNHYKRQVVQSFVDILNLAS